MTKNIILPKLDIGIPAYNEEKNISTLLDTMLNQNRNNYKLNTIYVVSDASTDSTNKILRRYPSKFVCPIILKERKGQPNAQNEIIKRADADLLLFLNADTLPKDNNFIDAMVVELRKNKNIGIVSALTESVKPQNFVEKVVVAGRNFKLDVYKNWKDGNNIFLCHGRSRLFIKALYKKLHFPDLCPEDAYSYLFCISNGYSFKFTDKAINTFKSPQTFTDYRKQSNRFFSGKFNLNKYFHLNIIEKEYDVPINLFVSSFMKNIFKYHIYLLMYFLFLGYSFITNKSKYTSLWLQINTSKEI